MTDIAIAQALKLLLEKHYIDERVKARGMFITAHSMDMENMAGAVEYVDNVYGPVLKGLDELIDRD